MIPLGVLASGRMAAVAPAVISDSFNRANGALGVTDTGQTWSTTGTTAINNNQAQLDGTASAFVTAPSINQTVSARFVTRTEYNALTARAGAFQLFTATAGGAITCRANGSDTPTGATAATNDVLALTVKEVSGGTQVTAFRNGSQIYTVLDTRGGRDVTSLTFGISTYIYAALFDDFEVTPA